MLKLALSGFTSFSFVPLRAATWTGTGLAAFAVLYPVFRGGLALAGLFEFGSAGLVGFLALLAGLQLIAIGTVGEYLARVFEEAVDRPLYLVKEWTDGGTRVIPPPRASTPTT
jgi:hypothetical protein